jgi:hypothetical protein
VVPPGHQSGIGAGGSILGSGQDARHVAAAQRVDRAQAAGFAVLLLEEPHHPPRIVAQYGEQPRQAGQQPLVGQHLPLRVSRCSPGQLDAQDFVAHRFSRMPWADVPSSATNWDALSMSGWEFENECPFRCADDRKNEMIPKGIHFQVRLIFRL